MKENDFLEETETNEESVIDLDVFEEVMMEKEIAREVSQVAADPEHTEDGFDALAQAVNDAAEAELTGTGEPEPAREAAETPQAEPDEPAAMPEMTQIPTLEESVSAMPEMDAPGESPEEEPGAAEEPAIEDFSQDEAEVKALPIADGEDLLAESPAAPQRPSRKGRPKRRKGYALFGIPHLIAAIIWLLIIGAIGVTLGRVVWVCAADVLAFGRPNSEVTFTIDSDDTIEEIAENLRQSGLINYPELFLLYADLADVVEENKISTGTFTLNTIYDYNALVKAMSPSSGSRTVVEDVLIPEGFNCRQIFALMEEKGICKAAELEAYAADGALNDYWFLEGLERGDKYCLEGFLFPDTYDFYANSSPREVLNKLLGGFSHRFTEEMRTQLTALNERITEMMRENGDSEEYIAEHQMDLRSLITVASLIEEETSSGEEGHKIASVIYNRLFSWGKTPRYLNIDATLIYALGGKTDLTAEDKTVDSPYNTYNHMGLTPGPITNPGLSSIKAALEPEDTDYYYYVLDPTVGSHVFTSNLEDHEEAVEEVRKKAAAAAEETNEE